MGKKTKICGSIVVCLAVFIVICMVVHHNKVEYSASYGMTFQVSRMYVNTAGETYLEIEYDDGNKKYSKDLPLKIEGSSLDHELDNDNIDQVIGGLILLNVPKSKIKSICPDYQIVDSSYFLYNDLLDDYMKIVSLDFQ